MNTAKTAIVTGASHGIGQMTALKLAAAGYDLAQCRVDVYMPSFRQSSFGGVVMFVHSRQIESGDTIFGLFYNHIILHLGEEYSGTKIK